MPESYRRKMRSEINEEDDDEEALCLINTEAQKDKIRRIIEHQKSLYLSSSSSSSSAAASCSSFSSSRRSCSLLDLMKGGSTSLRRLFEMEHTSLATHFSDYSGSPMIRPILLWGSDTDDGVNHEDPWKSIARIGALMDSSRSEGRLSGLSPLERRKFMDEFEESVHQNRVPRTGGKHKLTRKKSFRRLPRFSFWRCRGFRFRLGLRRRLRIMVCGRKF